MDRTNNGRVTIDELAMLLGSKDVEIYSLQKQLQSANARIAELTPKPEPVTPA